MKIKMFKYLFSILLVLSLISSSLTSFAQYAYFIETGKIEFEKKVNMYAKLKSRVKDDNAFMQKIYDEYRRTQPQFNTSKSTLSFSKDKSIYQFLEEDKAASGFFGSEPWLMVKNEVHHNFNTDSVISIKKVYGEDYIVKDKKREVLWKITNEMREIAGYQCRRANGLILDSVYVVAFFSEEILPSGGPESFSGLPGMILGIALPHENVTWFATKVEPNNQSSSSVIKPPKKAKQVTGKEYEADLKKSMKGWGEWGYDALKAFLL